MGGEGESGPFKVYAVYLIIYCQVVLMGSVKQVITFPEDPSRTIT